MTVAFIDTSCLVAVAFAEPGAEALATRLASIEQLFASNLLEAELRAALRREGVDDGDSMLEGLSWVLPDRPLTREIAAVLEAGHLRGADAWHLACALYLSPRPTELEFLTLDTRQAAVAVALGFAGGPVTPTD
jgi:predicted nucleic acid-binding protein